jgi:phosphoribosylglycinamide formyltransferase-1
MLQKWGVLISGRGSNLAALLELGSEIDIRVVISSSTTAPGVLRARRAGVSAEFFPRDGKKLDWVALDRRFSEYGVTHVFLAGFMRIVPAAFLEKWAGRVLNLHPSLLPTYPGLDSIARAYADHADLGVTVHEVIEDVDAGKMICQRRSLNAGEVHEYSLDASEFYMHVDEQRIVKEAIRSFNSQHLAKEGRMNGF